MPLEVYFLNQSIINAKSGKTYHKLTVAQKDGEVLEFFAEKALDIPGNIPLFTPLMLNVTLQPIGGNVRLGLVSVDSINGKEVK